MAHAIPARSVGYTYAANLLKRPSTPTIALIFHSHCYNCHEAFDDFAQIIQKYRPLGVNVILISTDYKMKYLEQFLKEHPTTVPVYRLSGNVHRFKKGISKHGLIDYSPYHSMIAFNDGTMDLWAIYNRSSDLIEPLRLSLGIISKRGCDLENDTCVMDRIDLFIAKVISFLGS